jgi:hydroxymethylglutaryl-CoA lyase
VRALADAGLRRIEATSFVSPRWIPQLGDADALEPALPRLPGVSYVVLVPNAKGLERLLGCKVFLQLHVRVDERWSERADALRRHGL